jgi:two-component system, cell cycle sensor histidine kinase and response regulator CckA
MADRTLRTERAQNADRVVAGVVIASAVASSLLILRVTDKPLLAASFGAAAIAIGALMLAIRHLYPAAPRVAQGIDWSLVRQAADNERVSLAITDRSGRLVCANDRHESLFGGAAVPPGLPLEAGDINRLTAAGRAAWRDGRADVKDVAREGRRFDCEITRAGQGEDCLIWRFRAAGGVDRLTQAMGIIETGWGDRLAEAGVMIALIGQEGRIRSANAPLVVRALGRLEAPVAGREFVTLLSSDAKGVIRFATEGPAGVPLRLIQIPIEPGDGEGARLIVLIDEDGIGSNMQGADVTLQNLLSMLPLGLALADRDGRFLYLNRAFIRAAGVPAGATPIYPGDLVIREDKAAVADAVRRYAAGHAASGDMAVRLRDRPEEPVALTIAGARGLGDAAVLLSLKDNTEESRLKREVAQATKMQAVGQLAGGVAHDFNNILTGIIGHCDLMLMRHTPGDSDYDDIQQIRINSNRAAALTRQLLAFSRQQTLRPQVLQLPDVVSEVSNLLQRLLGETVTLVIKHGRGLGAVRADPGQLEQVIVNLAVNGRDAMLDKGGGGGTLTLQTYPVLASDVRKMGSDILPVADYTALKVSDTGTGIPPEMLSKIFEPFFTTKEVGKGTGLGLSTVYGIVKQSNGFIFADSEPGKGASFTIYLPVHVETGEIALEAPKAERPAELWGSGTVLLVEDEDMVRVVAERALTRHGYTVVTAEHGEDALEIFASGEHEFDLLISDVVMPTMDGPTMVRHVREKMPDIPVLFMSGYAEEQLRKSIDLDRVHFLPKPFSVKQLAEAAQMALAGAPKE